MNNLINVVITILLASIGYVLPVNANNIPLTSDNFTTEGKTVKFTHYKGEKSLLLNNASATLNDLSFTNGIIEYDVAFAKQRNFVDVKFRQQDSKNTEKFYIRPHQSGNPDANQYTPVFNGLSAWQLYRQGFSGKVNYNFADWNHVKIIVAGKQGEVYINDMQKPAFVINEFLRPIKAGSISFSSAMSDAYIANISIVKHEKPQALPTTVVTKTVPAKKSALQDNLMQWQVSNSFNKSTLAKVTHLEPTHTNDLRWTPLTADNYGVLNLAKVQGVLADKDTAFAKTIFYSDSEQINALHFGYSDKVSVYLNNQLIYSGDNSFRSRDYRYLGTIGLFDTLYLPLQKGENELIFAVSEKFGGWGLQATITK